VTVDGDAAFQRSVADEYAALTWIVSEYDGRLVTIKSWSVTLSLASIGLGFQQQHYSLFAVGAVSGICFWLIESMSKRHQVRYYPRMRQIEAWSATATNLMIGDQRVSAPRIDSAWTAAGRADPEAALRETPREMTSEEIRRMRRHVLWLPHVFMPSLIAVVGGVGLLIAAAAGAFDMPL